MCFASCRPERRVQERQFAVWRPVEQDEECECEILKNSYETALPAAIAATQINQQFYEVNCHKSETDAVSEKGEKQAFQMLGKERQARALQQIAWWKFQLYWSKKNNNNVYAAKKMMECSRGRVNWQNLAFKKVEHLRDAIIKLWMRQNVKNKSHLPQEIENHNPH